MNDATEAIGIAEIDHKFSITGRGTFLALKDGWAGRLVKGGTFQRGDRRAKIVSFDFAYFGAGKPELVCLLIDDQELATEIAAGDLVGFFALPSDSDPG